MNQNRPYFAFKVHKMPAGIQGHDFGWICSFEHRTTAKRVLNTTTLCNCFLWFGCGTGRTGLFGNLVDGGKSSVSLLIPLASSGLGSPRTKRHLGGTPQVIILIFYLVPSTTSKNVLQVSQSSCLLLRTFVVSCDVPRSRNFPDFGSGRQRAFYVP